MGARSYVQAVHSHHDQALRRIQFHGEHGGSQEPTHIVGVIVCTRLIEEELIHARVTEIMEGADARLHRKVGRLHRACRPIIGSYA